MLTMEAAARILGTETASGVPAGMTITFPLLPIVATGLLPGHGATGRRLSAALLWLASPRAVPRTGHAVETKRSLHRPGDP